MVTADEKCTATSYHTELVDEFVEITRQNIAKRCEELTYIVNNNHFIANGPNKFDYDLSKFVDSAMESVIPLIQSKTIVQLDACGKIPSSKHEYKKVARNRLNRNKPKFLGDFVFAPLIYDQLYKFCSDVFQSHQMVVFVSLLQDVLSPSAVVRFEQTRAQPLVPYNTLVMDNAFKDSCLALLSHFKLAKQWRMGSKPGNGKKQSAKDVWQCFIETCLPKVAERCIKFDCVIPTSLMSHRTIKFVTSTPIIPISPSNHYDANNNNNDYKNNDGNAHIYERDHIQQNHHHNELNHGYYHDQMESSYMMPPRNNYSSNYFPNNNNNNNNNNNAYGNVYNGHNTCVSVQNNLPQNAYLPYLPLPPIPQPTYVNQHDLPPPIEYHMHPTALLETHSSATFGNQQQFIRPVLDEMDVLCAESPLLPDEDPTTSNNTSFSSVNTVNMELDCDHDEDMTQLASPPPPFPNPMQRFDDLEMDCSLIQEDCLLETEDIAFALSSPIL